MNRDENRVSALGERVAPLCPPPYLKNELMIFSLKSIGVQWFLTVAKG